MGLRFLGFALGEKFPLAQWFPSSRMPCYLVWEVKLLTTIAMIGTNSGLRVDLNSATINHLDGAGQRLGCGDLMVRGQFSVALPHSLPGDWQFTRQWVDQFAGSSSFLKGWGP